MNEHFGSYSATFNFGNSGKSSTVNFSNQFISSLIEIVKTDFQLISSFEKTEQTLIKI